MKCYGTCSPGLCDEELPGTLVVIEGPDGVGRSTHTNLLIEWLESRGHAVVQIGLSRSQLAGPELEAAKEGHALRPYPMSLFYAADFFDQLENQVIPALRAGMVVIADRYVHTLIARSIVRGVDEDRVKRVFDGAIVPDVVFKLHARPQALVERLLHKQGELDYWESGMDLGLDTDWYNSFVRYQKKLHRTWALLEDSHPFVQINANRRISAVQKELRDLLKPLLRKAKPSKTD